MNIYIYTYTSVETNKRDTVNTQQVEDLLIVVISKHAGHVTTKKRRLVPFNLNKMVHVIATVDLRHDKEWTETHLQPLGNGRKERSHGADGPQHSRNR